MLYEIQTLAVVVFLAGCWACELVVPAVQMARTDSRAVRCRHLVLGAINAIPTIGIASLLGIMDTYATRNGIGLLKLLDLPVWGAALAAFLILDLCQYTSHVVMHKVPFLWRMHAVHHHAEHVESTTAFRFHTLEVVAHGLMLIPLLLIFGFRIHDLALYNAIVIPMSVFHHANIRLPRQLERVLRVFIITPGSHRLHHARWQPLTDSNYGAVLSIWDRIFGTASARSDPEAIPVGLDGFKPEEIESLRGMLGTPFSSSRAGLGTPPPGEHPRPAKQVKSQRAERPCNRAAEARV